jgi:hypothetical protein
MFQNPSKNGACVFSRAIAILEEKTGKLKGFRGIPLTRKENKKSG